MAAEIALHERPEDQGLGRAVALAIGLHVLLALLAWLSSMFDWQRDPLAAEGLPVMNADLDVSATEAAAARQALEDVPQPLPEPAPEPEPEPEEVAPPPQPIPEPVPEEAPVERQVQAQERIPVPDAEDQDEVSAEAISREKREREQEEKRRQEQIDLTERERQKEAEERQRLARQAEAEQKKAEREKKLAQIRAEREKLQRQAQLAEQKLRQIADARARSASEAATQSDANATGSPPPGNNGVDEGLLRQYIAAIQGAVTSKWTRPDNMPSLPCKMTIIQLPGGQVMDVQFDASCPYDEAGKRSVEAAVRKAQPLPYAGFEPVFNRRLNFTFRPN